MADAEKASFEIPSSVLSRQVDQQMVLLDLVSEQYFGLNETGAHIVTRLTEEPLEKALAELARDYDVEPSVLRRDVDALVDQLLRAGLLVRVDPSDGSGI